MLTQTLSKIVNLKSTTRRRCTLSLQLTRYQSASPNESRKRKTVLRTWRHKRVGDTPHWARSVDVKNCPSLKKSRVWAISCVGTSGYVYVIMYALLVHVFWRVRICARLLVTHACAFVCVCYRARVSTRRSWRHQVWFRLWSNEHSRTHMSIAHTRAH